MKAKRHYRPGIAAIFAALVFQSPVVTAGIVSTDQMTAQQQKDSDREKVQSFMERADVKQRMQAMGVEGLIAKERVAALSDDEVHALARKIDSMPAGGNLNNSDLIVILLVAILVAIAV